MVLLESTPIKLNSIMPNFELKDPFNNTHSSQSLMGKKGLLIIFTCNHCPYAIAIWERTITLSSFAKKLGINTVAINPNINPEYPEDSPENMIKFIQKNDISFPYLIDKKQNTAKEFNAQCTPDIYLLNNQSQLVYHGQLDNNWKDPKQVTREDLKDAISNLSSNNPISTEQSPSMGCSIKWL